MRAHSVLMTGPAGLIDRYRAWVERMIQRCQNLLPDSGITTSSPPCWFSVYPYRVDLTQSYSWTAQVILCNLPKRPQMHHVELKLSPGIEAETPDTQR